MFWVTVVFMTALCVFFMWIASNPTSHPKKRKAGRKTWPGRMANVTHWSRGSGKAQVGKSSPEFIQKGVRAIARSEADGDWIAAEMVIAKLEAKVAAARVLFQEKKRVL